MRRVLIAASALAVIVCHGRPAHAAQAVSGMLYVLSTGDNGRSTLRTVDVPSWRVTETVSLPRPRGRALALDPQGRPWVTHSGGPERDDDRVRVLAGSGAPSTTMRTCRRPDAGIAFAAGRAFVACAENGLGGSVDVFDVNTLAHVATISVAPPAGGAYYLTAVAASGARVVLAGMAKGPDPKRRYAAIATLDAEQPAVTWQSEPIADLDVWSIVPYGEDFLLANVASGASGETEHRADVLRLRPTNQLERITVAPSPLWAAVANDVLHLYHNPSWNSVSSSPTRMLSAYHLTKRTVTRRTLPDGFDAGSIAVVGDKIVLASSGDGRGRGVYAYDMKDELLVEPIPVPDADKLAVVGSKESQP